MNVADPSAGLVPEYFLALAGAEQFPLEPVCEARERDDEASCPSMTARRGYEDYYGLRLVDRPRTKPRVWAAIGPTSRRASPARTRLIGVVFGLVACVYAGGVPLAAARILHWVAGSDTPHHASTRMALARVAHSAAWSVPRVEREAVTAPPFR